MAKSNKAKARKVIDDQVWSGPAWKVMSGELKRRQGRPHAAAPLFKVVAEKLPFESLDSVRKHLHNSGVSATGVYVAHDSMGVARYIGRGNIFNRLKARHKAQVLELKYFSFYVGLQKAHEREIETLLIRSVGPSLHFNTRKKRVDIQAGNIRDYEAGTLFYTRQYKRGKKAKGHA